MRTGGCRPSAIVGVRQGTDQRRTGNSAVGRKRKEGLDKYRPRGGGLSGTGQRAGELPTSCKDRQNRLGQVRKGEEAT